MYYLVYDASRALRFESDNWPMARSALDLVIQEAQESDCPGDCPRLEIYPLTGGLNNDRPICLCVVLRRLWHRLRLLLPGLLPGPAGPRP